MLDDFYAGSCEAVAMDTHQLRLWWQGVIVAGNALVANFNSSQAMGLWWQQNTAAQNDKIKFNLSVPDGTYQIRMKGITRSVCGITHILVDGVDQAQIDWYTATNVFDVDKTATITIALGGEHEIAFLCSTKNASSSSYEQRITFWEIRRTGD